MLGGDGFFDGDLLWDAERHYGAVADSRGHTRVLVDEIASGTAVCLGKDFLMRFVVHTNIISRL